MGLDPQLIHRGCRDVHHDITLAEADSIRFRYGQVADADASGEFGRNSPGVKRYTFRLNRHETGIRLFLEEHVEAAPEP